MVPGATISLVGADGAGKTTLALSIVETLPVAASYLYMGDNPGSSSHLLPTTRLLWWARRRRGVLWPHGPPFAAVAAREHGLVVRCARLVVALGVLAIQMAEEAHQLARARAELRKGRVVVLDRYFRFDYHAHALTDPGRPGLVPRLHGAWLGWAFPHPDLAVCLDAAPDVLFARKGEGDEASLTRRRQGYLNLAVETPRFVVVDAGRPRSEVEREVLAVVMARLVTPQLTG